MDVGGLDEGGSRLGRGKGRGAGYGSLGSIRARRRLVWFGAKRGGAAREGGALALSEPSLLLTESHDSWNPVTTLQN